MNDEIKEQLDYLGLKRLTKTWDETMKTAGRKNKQLFNLRYKK